MSSEISLKSVGLVIKPSRGKGTGVFVSKPRKKGAVIDISCSWELSPSEIRLIDLTSLEGFWFDHPTKPGWGLFPVGLIGMINHSSVKNNAKITWVKGNNRYLGFLELIKDLSTGTEVLINYGIDLPVDWVS